MRAVGMAGLAILACHVVRAAIPLDGVTGENIRARAFFDANNVKTGDPLILTLDFLGTADFKALHPPALSRCVNRKDWKVYDTSAKTQTESRQVGTFFSSREIDVARRLTYRVVPRREGVVWFPALEFEYVTASGEKRTVRSNEIPVHARPGRDVTDDVKDKMGEDETAMPQPDALVTEAGVPLTDDERFAWRRACAIATNADAFAAFDFPAAKLDEARAAILAGDWKRAMQVYQRLEWRIGQTPAVEQGIVAALALRYQNPLAELPMWRQVGRPLLRYGWLGRAGWFGGGLAAFVLAFWLLGKIIRALACVAILAAAAGATALPADAEDPFAAMERMMQEQQKRMQQLMSGSFGGGFSVNFGGESRSAPKVTARLALSQPAPRVGERFDFIISLEVPKGCTIEPSNFSASNGFGLTFVTGRGEPLTDGKSANTNNVVRRIAIPARYDMPFKGNVSFTVSGMVTGQRGGRRGGFNVTFSNSFEAKTPEVPIEVKPLENPPEGFAGIVAARMAFEEIPDAVRVQSNDVIRITYRMGMNGWLPEGWMPEGAAFEWGRNADRRGAVTAEWQRYFVADGAAATPKVKLVYYDPKTKKYQTLTAGGRPITYE